MLNFPKVTKPSDIYMREKYFQLHLSKMRQIQSISPIPSARYSSQQRLLTKLSSHKQEVKTRQINGIRQENHRIFERLMQAQIRKESGPEQSKVRHFNHYYSSRLERSRISEQNQTMMTRLMHNSSAVPPVEQMRREFKKNRKLKNNCRKLPTLVRLEHDMKSKVVNEKTKSQKTSRSKDVKESQTKQISTEQ